MRKVLISVAVAFCMVGVLSWLLFRSPGGGDSGEGDAPAVTGSTVAKKAVRKALVTPAGGATQAKKDSAGAAAEGPNKEGVVLLSGKVLDPEGRGVPGARIVVRRGDEEGGGFESFIRARALNRPAPSEVLARAVSGADGAYAVAFAAAPEQGEYRVEARAPGFLPAEESWLFEGAPGVLDFHLDDGGETIEGIVVDLAGAAIEGASVDAAEDGDDRFARFRGRSGSGVDRVSTDAAGAFRLVVTPGRYRVTARAEGHIAASASEVESGTQGLRIELGPSRGLSGRVVDDMGNPVAGALLAAYPGDDRGGGPGGPGGGRGGFGAVRRFMDPAGRAETDADGHFTLTDLSLRGYQVEARKGGFEVAVERGTLPAEGESTPVEIQLKPGGILTGTVTDGDGSPVKGALVLLRDEGNDRDRGEGRGGRDGGRFGGRDPSGRFGGGGPGGRGGGFGGREGGPGGGGGAPGAEGGAGENGGGGFRGRRGETAAANAGGPPQGGRGRGPEASRAGETMSLFRAEHLTETDESGKFTFDTIARSNYTLGVRSDRHPFFTKNAVAVEERTEVPITLDKGAALVGRVLESGDSTPVPRALVRLRMGNEDRRQIRSDAEGKFRLEGLLPGRLEEVQVQARGYTTLYVEGLEIKAQSGEETHDLLLDRAASMSGLVMNARGEPVVNARVRVASTDGETLQVPGENEQAEPGAFDLTRLLSRRRTETQRSTSTKADGTFHLENVSAGTSYRAIITHPDYQEFRSDPVAVQSGAKIENLVYKLRAGGRLTVLVLRPDRSPAPGLGVVVSRQREEESGGGGGDRRFNFAQRRNDRLSRNTSPEGKAVFAGMQGGLYTVQVSASGFQPFRQRDVSVVDDQSSDFVAQLLPENFIAGVVGDSGGNPIAGVSVRASPAGESRQDLQNAIFGGGRGGGFGGGGFGGFGGGERSGATSLADGTFKLGSLGAGPYQVFLTARGYADQRIESVEVNGRPLEVQLLKKGAIEGVVTVGETGQPVTSFRVMVLRDGQGGQQSENESGPGGEGGRDPRRGRGGRPERSMDVEDAGGAFVIPDIDPGAYAVRVSAEGLTPREVTVRVQEGTAAAARVQLFAGIVVAGLVVLEGTSDPVEGAEISVIAAPEEEAGAATSAEGRRSGVQRVSESTRPGSGRQGGGERAGGAGGPGGSGRGGGRRTGRSVVPPTQTDAAGGFALQGVTPGKYVLIANHPDFIIAQQSFEIREEGLTRELRINLKAGEELSGTVAEADGSAAAGVSVSVRDSNGLSKRVTTDVAGRYFVRGLVPGTHTVSIFSQGATPVRIQVEVKQGAANRAEDIKRQARTE